MLPYAVSKRDDGDLRSKHLVAVTDVATRLDAALRRHVGATEFSIDNARTALNSTLQTILKEVEIEYAKMGNEDQARMEEILGFVREGTKQVQAILNNVNNPIVKGVSGALGLVPNLVAFFIKDPNPDDFVGCTTTSVVSTNKTLWNEINNGTSICTLGSGPGWCFGLLVRGIPKSST